MRVGLITDTHIPGSMKEMPYQVARAFEGVDMILHNGDIYGAQVLDWLDQIAPVYAVVGDGLDHHIKHPRLQPQHILNLDGVSVAMIHMFTLPQMSSEIWPGAIERDFPKNTSLRDTVHKIFNHPVDVVVFGDTHFDTCEWHDGILIINSGSPTLPRQMRRLGTVGILEIEDGRVEGKILDLNDFSVEGMPPTAYY